MYLSLVVLTIILGIILGLSSMVISQIRMVRGMEHSVIAFHAANSGVERALSILPGLYPAGLPFNVTSTMITLNGGATTTYRVIINRGTLAPGGFTGGCNSNYYCIISIGNFRGIERAIEVGN